MPGLVTAIPAPGHTEKTGRVSDRIVTTVVGSYPPPDWLVDKDRFQTNLAPRVRMREVWRVG